MGRLLRFEGIEDRGILAIEGFKGIPINGTKREAIEGVPPYIGGIAHFLKVPRVGYMNPVRHEAMHRVCYLALGFPCGDTTYGRGINYKGPADFNTL